MESSYIIDRSESANAYDKEAETSNWFGPEVVFGLSYKYIKDNQKIIDIGIGTGLSSFLYYKAGLRVYGLDISDEMLGLSQKKIPKAQLIKHDLLSEPYPYESKTMNHAVCTGVMNFFKDLNVVFKEVSRILQPTGIFGFVVADQKIGEEAEIIIGSEHTHSDKTVTIYKHGQKQIEELSSKYEFNIIRSLEFPIFMDSNKRSRYRAKAYITEKA